MFGGEKLSVPEVAAPLGRKVSLVDIALRGVVRRLTGSGHLPPQLVERLTEWKRPDVTWRWPSSPAGPGPRGSRSGPGGGWWSGRSGWLTRWRRLNRNYEHTHESSKAVVQVALIGLMARRLAKTQLCSASHLSVERFFGWPRSVSRAVHGFGSLAICSSVAAWSAWPRARCKAARCL
jgi:hypothetical protein